MSPLLWFVAVPLWAATVAVPALVLYQRWRGKTPAPAASTPQAPATPGAGAAAPPFPLGAGPDVPARPAPAPALTPSQAAALGRYQRLLALGLLTGHATAGREIADGLRQRFPGLDDTTLGAIAMDLHGYAVTLAVGLPSTAQALQAIIDCYALAAEDLTRLERTETFDDQH